jgi:hypothetical protein
MESMVIEDFLTPNPKKIEKYCQKYDNLRSLLGSFQDPHSNEAVDGEIWAGEQE